MLSKLYLALGAVLIGGYATSALSGVEFGKAQLRKAPPVIRQPYRGRTGYGGYRYGGGGYRGGK